MAETLIALGIGAKTAAGIVSAASTAAQVATVGGAVLSGATAFTGARNQAAAMESQAALQEQQANDRAVTASIEAERLRRQQRTALARDRAATFGAGAGSGTSLDLLDQNTVAAELDALTVQYGGRQDAATQRQQAGATRMQADTVRSGAPFEAVGRLASGLSTLRFDPLNMDAE